MRRGGIPGRTLSVACGDIFPRPGEVFPLRWRPWQRGQVSSSIVNGRRSQPISGKLSALAKASPFRERWHGKAVTERVVSGTNPLSRLRRQLSRRESPWQRGQVSSSFVNGIRSQPISGKLSALAKASPFRERWHGKAVTERVASRKNPLSRLRRQLSRRESPWQNQQVSSSFVNGRRSQPLSCKLSALAKASPFRERWHGEAVTERVSPRLAAAFGECFPNRSRGKIEKSVCAKENIPSDAFCPAERPTAET